MSTRKEETRWFEIIHLRSSAESLESLSDRINESIMGVTDGRQVVTLYRRQGLETDLAVHIRHLDRPDRRQPSRLALRLASELKAYGLVEHTLWEQLR